MLYLGVSVLTGIFGGAQSLGFNIMGRRLANTIRNKLFRGMLHQDVAFFDGNTSGQLTSRLSTDAREMVSPIQTAMGSLLSNLIRLIGGVVLCFYTSWRLSMLAFTTVGPIITITQVYAGWSQGLNRQIYAALGAANGIATEALGNIRTVKAMSTEDMEVRCLDTLPLCSFGGALPRYPAPVLFCSLQSFLILEGTISTPHAADKWPGASNK
jgi:ABC-type multidrug transport system fused ATPase/permease subunit